MTTTTTTTTTTRSSKQIRNGFVSRKISDLLIFMTMTMTTTTFMHATEAFQQLNKYNKQIIILPSCSKFIGTGCCHNIPRRRTRTRTRTERKCKSSLMTMRDRSASYWFTKGDKVKVIEDVFMNSNQQKTNLRNKEGIVVETWEKCNVDPTCCCAEQVDTNYAVRVLFNNNTNDANNATTTTQNKNDDDDDEDEEKSTALASASTSTSSLFYYYFAEDELIKAL